MGLVTREWAWSELKKYGNTCSSHAVGTQTTLTFPATFDLEKLLLAACHAHCGDCCGRGGGGEDGGAAAAAAVVMAATGRETIDAGNASTLRRKLFGQPERMVGM